MLQTVDVGRRSLESYRGLAPPAVLDELQRRAEGLRGARVLHVNATPYGGGVSELLRAAVPLLRDLGIEAEWRVIGGDREFFEATKALHNALQGSARGLTAAQRAEYEGHAEREAARLGAGHDFVFVHDPQPAPLLAFGGAGDARWVWRCHIDTSQPNPEAWAYLRPFVGAYEAAIFTMSEFLPPELSVPRVDIVPPAIDPLSPKNMPLPASTSRQVLDWIGIRLERPLVTQVSRFDRWKDPLGVIAAYRLARLEVPNLQLALVGSMALDDPEGWDVYRQIADEAEGDELIDIFTNLTGVGSIEVNAFQRHSQVVVQKSVREGFGLVVSEALWKGTPVVAGEAGGIKLQMADGVGGRLINTVEGCAEALVELLSDPPEAQRQAELGRERVREHFLLPRLLLNEVSLMLDLERERPERRGELVEGALRDPVCGIALREGGTALWATLDGQVHAFCSERCRTEFLRGAGASGR